jgi:Skp family chaperone for outer membrane proteins
LVGLGAGFAGVGLLGSKPAIAQHSAAAPRIATVDALALVERVVLSEPYDKARNDKTSQIRSAIQPLSDKINDINTRASAVSQEAPDFGAQMDKLRAEFEEAQPKLQEAQKAGQAELEALNAAQLREAYKIVYDATDKLASSLGYSHVLVSRTGEPTFRSTDVNNIVQEMVARSVLKTEAADDLTQRLITELKLENVKVPDLNAPATTPAPAEAPRQ